MRNIPRGYAISRFNKTGEITRGTGVVGGAAAARDHSANEVDLGEGSPSEILEVESEKDKRLSQFVVDDDATSFASSQLSDDDDGDLYLTSIMALNEVRAPEDLIDQDLLGLLTFIKTLSKPSDDELINRQVSFGDPTRHKTLIFDLDETLIQSHLLPRGVEESKVIED